MPLYLPVTMMVKICYKKKIYIYIKSLAYTKHICNTNSDKTNIFLAFEGEYENILDYILVEFIALTILPHSAIKYIKVLVILHAIVFF